MSEARTRQELIDPALQKSGWDVHNPHQVGLEIPVDGADPAAVQKMLARLRHVKEAPALFATPLPSGICDYALYRDNGEIIAIVEAKRTSIDARLAQAQAEFYVEEIAKWQSFRPFAFMTNGRDTYFRDNGAANKRKVQLLASGTAGSMTNISKDKLLELRLPLPPASAQASFKAAVINYERIFRQLEAERQTEHLFQTLLHEALNE